MHDDFKLNQWNAVYGAVLAGLMLEAAKEKRVVTDAEFSTMVAAAVVIAERNEARMFGRKDGG